MGEIELVSYRSEWNEMFLREKIFLQNIPKLDAILIEHVGSTSIPEQIAKPVVDIFVGVTTLKTLSEYKKILPSPNYQYTKTGMEHRYLFQKVIEKNWCYNIHILSVEGFYERSEIIIRDFLRDNPQYVVEYGILKQKLAIKAKGNLEEYTRSKTVFLQNIYNLACYELGLPIKEIWKEKDSF